MSIPNNLLRRISELSTSPTRRALSRATERRNVTRRTLPIGLAVTRVGGPAVPPPRRVVSRTRETAKTPRLKYFSNSIDRVAPQAYKNNTWRYYVYPTRNRVIFFNTRNSPAYTFNKDGRRVPVPQTYFARTGLNMNTLRRYAHPRKAYHTFEQYQKRLGRNQRLERGKPIRNAIYMNIHSKVRRFSEGDAHALNDVSFSKLLYWANHNPLMGSPYIKYGGVWRRYGSQLPLTRQNILNNIRLINDTL